ncbi:MAG: glycosyltransferase family 4 protein [Gaiellales bacterium]
MIRDRGRRYAEAGLRTARLLTHRHPSPGLRVGYGHDRIPAPGERAAGGSVKYQRLATRFPNRMDDFTLLYLGSSGLPRDLGLVLALARRRKAPIVLNQDGVGYPAWAGDRVAEVNRPLRRALLAADHVVYQTQFCKNDADHYLGEPRGTWEILPNAVDCEHFTPGHVPEGPPTLLLAGNQTSPGRLGLALRTIAAVRATEPEARLIVAGLVPAPELGPFANTGNGVELVGPYTQAEAPALYRRAHVLLHTKPLDPCPNVVLEAMACGLPVVFPASGGVPELVGDAGVGVRHDVSHERLSLPTAEAMAAGVLTALEEREALSASARVRAVERFPLPRWLEHHAELFAELLARSARPPQ